jgi:hypothetical protein
MDVYELAELMHTKLCRWDHTEQCAWYYRDKQMTKWVDSWEHKKWLEKAHILIFEVDLSIEDIAKVIKAL